MNLLSDTDLAYIAGFFDGEGCVTWQKTTRKSGKLYKLIRIDIGQVDRSFLDYCQLHYGGYISMRNTNKHRSKQENFQWTLTGDSAVRFLQTIVPFLRQKQAKAMQCINEWNTRKYDCSASYPGGM